MTITIQLQYYTRPGESVQLCTARRHIPMDCIYAGQWQVILEGKELLDGDRFGFAVVRGASIVAREWRDHIFKAPHAQKNIIVRSRWLQQPGNSLFYSSAFTDVIFRRGDGASFRHIRPEGPDLGNFCVRIAAPEVRSDEFVGLVGSGETLGDWKKIHPLSDACFPWWFLSMDLQEPVEYKFVIADRASGRIRLWEEGPNHFLGELPPKDTQLIIANLEPRFPTLPWRGAGVAVPVFSLRSRDSLGVGEFQDLKKLADWAAECGQNIIQLLPVNDTTRSHTSEDSYPYSAVSSFALHPMYLNLPAAGVRRTAAYKALQERLEASPQLDYEEVNRAKTALVRKLYDSPRGMAVLASGAYAAFVRENRSWLLPYAVFCCLRERFGTADFHAWGASWARYSDRKAAAFARDNAHEVGFYYFVQYLLDAQLRDAVDYAHSRGVALKGDLPIGVSPASADVWQHPDLFHLDSQAGAPPDAFAAQGQNWGFPTYNWERMAADGYAWWKARMRKMACYFDAYRIDHLLGFFRIWEIPSAYKSGLMGHFNPALPYSEEELRAMGFDPSEGTPPEVLFVKEPSRPGCWHPRIDGDKTTLFAALPEPLKERYRQLHQDFFWHRHNAFWEKGAMEKLPALLRSSDMLCCGEDLGMIPPCVAPVMERLAILSLEIQRMPKTPGEPFGHPGRYPYRSVCATGTHDTSTLRAWWEEDPALTRRYYNEILGMEGEAPAALEPQLAADIVSQHLGAPSILTILPLQDYLATDASVRYGGNPADERINIPSVAHHYWRYRMHCTLESLVGNGQFNSRLKQLVQSTGRGR